jgi:hypothetical protein
VRRELCTSVTGQCDIVFGVTVAIARIARGRSRRQSQQVLRDLRSGRGVDRGGVRSRAGGIIGVASTFVEDKSPFPALQISAHDGTESALPTRAKAGSAGVRIAVG